MTIDILPDLVLLEIFDFYMDEHQIEDWHTLVHVCRKWRIVVFGSPRRLNLRLLCTATTPVREMLDVWPLLPIVVSTNFHDLEIGSVENITAALEHNDRICQLYLDLPFGPWKLKEVLAKLQLQQPFPALKNLQLRYNQIELATPDSFLGGSAPSLQVLVLESVSFRGLPKLLLSATHLVGLHLWAIPYSGFISSKTMLAVLSTLTRLERLDIGFAEPRNRPVRRSAPLTRTLLPVLNGFWFVGVSEYLDDLVARLDAPLLNIMIITFFDQLISFNTPQLAQFISRTPKLNAYDKSRLRFYKRSVSVKLWQTADDSDRRIALQILCRPPKQLSSLAQVCGSSFPQALISGVKFLRIAASIKFLVSGWLGNNENSHRLEFLHPFTGVKGFYISRELAPHIGVALQELVGERLTEVLPALETLYFDAIPSRPVQEAIRLFIVARQLAGHPVAASLLGYGDLCEGGIWSDLEG